jgi:hypothetical protein
VRGQLSALLSKQGIDPMVSCAPEREPFLRCIATGLCLNVASLGKIISLLKIFEYSFILFFVFALILLFTKKFPALEIRKAIMAMAVEEEVETRGEGGAF